MAPLIDGHGRRISYLRLSVTDRCDLRCRYCMAEDMVFLPKSAVLSIEEMGELAARFVARGIRRIRLTGGEPLVRRGIDTLAMRLGAMIGHGLDELTLTTNGMRLAEYAPMLAAAGVRRINVSLDTLDPAAFRHITRVGDVEVALAGIAAARAAGLAVKINMVALAGLNEDQLLPMLDYCAATGCDLTLIETTPLGEVEADLLRIDVERGDELDVLDVVLTELDVHQTGHRAGRIRVLVVLDALDQGRGAVAHAHNCHAYRTHGFSFCRISRVACARGHAVWLVGSGSPASSPETV